MESGLEEVLLESQHAQEGCGPINLVGLRDSKSLRQQVFEQVRANGQVSRAMIARTLNVSPGSVTSITAELIAEGYLREVEGAAREAGRGRPPVALQVVPEVKRVIGIKISDERHTAVLTDFAGQVVASAALNIPTTKKPVATILDELEELVNRLMTTAGLPFSAVSGISVGISGVVDHSCGVVTWSPLIVETEVAMEQAIADRFNCPAHLENDANMLTLAELWFGAGRSRKDFAVVTVEHGVGMGMVINNQLYRGTRGMGMELGHIKVQLDGALCRCGQRGCLEAYLADYALAREASTALGISRNNPQSLPVMLETLYEKAKSDNRGARTIFQRAGRYLAVGLSNIINLFDPELIILSGERMRFDYLYAAEVLAETHSLTLNQARPRSKIEIQTWDDLVWARGAAALALSELTNRVFGETKLPA